MKKDFNENYAKFVSCKVLGIGKDSEKCEQKWKEIDSFYDTLCKGDFIEKFICVSILF
jgi:peroxiredoxin